MRSIVGSFVLSISIALIACGPGARGDDGDDGDDGPDGDPGTCTGSQTRCNGNGYEMCQDGGWVLIQSCTGDQVCYPGVGCQAPMEATCASAVAARSYIGCEYWPVDLDNATEVLGPEILPGFGCSIYTPSAVLQTLQVCWDGANAAGLCDYGGTCPTGTCQPQPVCVLDAQHSPYAIVVSNPSQSTTANVTISNNAGMMQTVAVPQSSVQTIFPQMLGMPDQSLDHSSVSAKAYKLVSDLPIVAYQFNPLNNVGVFSNDASLLIPAHAYDVEYIAMTYKTLTRRPTAHDYSGYITVVASGAGDTMVTVQPSAAVRAGDMVPAIAAGGMHQVTLTQFQTLNLSAIADGDLTGSTITCSQPCGIFVGHEATNLSQQNPSPCCADHLEEQLFPASTWGRLYVVAKSRARTTPVPDMVRVTAQRPNTMVTFRPAQAGCTAPLQRGQSCDVWVSGDVEVEANEPILVGHYLASNGGTDMDAGDPAITFAVPTEQYRSEYILLVPSQYNQSFMSIVAPAGGNVTVDGADVTAQLQPFGSNAYKAGRIPTTAGQHRIACGGGCGVEVYGWSDAVSYMYAAGLDLEQIVIE
jgi:hypothetical protein